MLVPCWNFESMLVKNGFAVSCFVVIPEHFQFNVLNCTLQCIVQCIATMFVPRERIYGLYVQEVKTFSPGKG